MTRTDWLLVLQGLGIVCQTINAQIGILTKSAAIALIVSALLGGFQYVIQRMGNNSAPPAPKGQQG